MGRPVLANILINPFATASAVIDLSGIASGHLDARQMEVKIYRYPPLTVGSGPTKSTAIDS